MSFFDAIRDLLFGGGNQSRRDVVNQPNSGPSQDEAEESLLHIGWRQRDEGIYPALFGPAEGEPVVLAEDIFRKDFARQQLHPFWLHHGVLTFPPTPTRATWIYASSGMSNAFDSEIEEWSGLGIEFVIETKERADWAADKLARLVAFNLLIAGGHYENSSDLKTGSIVRLDVPVNGDENCQLRNLIVLEAAAYFHENDRPTDDTQDAQFCAENAQKNAHIDAQEDTGEDIGEDVGGNRLKSAKEEAPEEGREATEIAANPAGSSAPIFKLVTGKFELLQIIAISDSEADFAEKEGYTVLAAKLEEENSFPVVDPMRHAVV